MNITNNRRRQETRRRIEEAFETLLQQKQLGEIRVTEICQMADVNRTTFYANYEDVYALSEAFQDSLLQKLLAQFDGEIAERQSRFNYEKLFSHIRENQLAYRTYFRLNPNGGFRWYGYDAELAERLFPPEHLKYHIAFFGNGLNAIIRLWLENGCRESPEEMAEILREEYRNVQNPWG